MEGKNLSNTGVGVPAIICRFFPCSTLTVLFRECEERMVSECSLETVEGLCTDMKIVEKCSPLEDCDMFSCKSVPDTRLEARNSHRCQGRYQKQERVGNSRPLRDQEIL